MDLYNRLAHMRGQQVNVNGEHLQLDADGVVEGVSDAIAARLLSMPEEWAEFNGDRDTLKAVTRGGGAGGALRFRKPPTKADDEKPSATEPRKPRKVRVIETPRKAADVVPTPGDNSEARPVQQYTDDQIAAAAAAQHPELSKAEPQADELRPSAPLVDEAPPAPPAEPNPDEVVTGEYPVDQDGNVNAWPDPDEKHPIEFLREMAKAYDIPGDPLKMNKKSLVKRIREAMYPED